MMKKLRKVLAGLMFLLITIVALIDQTDLNNRLTKEEFKKESYEVVRVVDGDTIIVKINNKNVTVRLIGIDTPESVHPDKERRSVEGEKASNFVKDLLKEKRVFLEYDLAREDKYGRQLAYVYLEDYTMLNRLLLEEGLAKLMTIQPNSKYSDEFAFLQKKARENKKGFWKE